jgi:hypothetical protein
MSMPEVPSTSCRVWWFEGFWEEDRCRAPVAAHADYGEEPFRNLSALGKEIRQRVVEFTPERGPTSLFVSHPQRGPNRVFDDLGPMTNSGILVSGAMIDLLSSFELGVTQLIEVPMYEGLGKPFSPSSGLKEPDLSRGVPGRWGVLHVRETKDAIIEEKCVGVNHSVEAPWLDYQMLSVPYRDKKTVIALESEVACAGADLWFDKRVSTVPFISDGLVRGTWLEAGQVAD